MIEDNEDLPVDIVPAMTLETLRRLWGDGFDAWNNQEEPTPDGEH